jgi:hypothetical protein
MLRELQEEFWRAITLPEGPEAPLTHQRGDVERLEVYANMYFYRLRDVLAQDFPALSAVLGEARFHNLITDYLRAHPSRDPSVRNLGRALPAYLDGSWLADLAALEWARLDVFDRTDEPVLQVGDLTELTLQVIAAHEVVRVQYAIEPIWRARAGQEAAYAPHSVLVWRRSDGVHHRPLAPDEAALWPLLCDGVSFVELCGRIDLPLEEAAHRAVQLLHSWSAAELLTARSR